MISRLKDLAVQNQDFDLAAGLRELENQVKDELQSEYTGPRHGFDDFLDLHLDVRMLKKLFTRMNAAELVCHALNGPTKPPFLPSDRQSPAEFALTTAVQMLQADREMLHRRSALLTAQRNIAPERTAAADRYEAEIQKWKTRALTCCFCQQEHQTLAELQRHSADCTSHPLHQKVPAASA